MSSRAGYVLVGGNSSRMGRDKALLPSHGKTLVQVVATTLGDVTGTVSLVGGSHSGMFPEFGFVPDLFPGEGPLGGILSALHNTAADWNVVVACDMPRLNAGFLRQLLELAESGESDAVVPVGPGGQVEPLCAAYHRRALPRLQASFDRGTRKIAAAFDEIRVANWKVPAELSCFQNVNTPEDWAAYER